MFSKIIKNFKLGMLESRAHKNIKEVAGVYELKTTKAMVSGNLDPETVSQGLEILTNLKDKFGRIYNNKNIDIDQQIHAANSWLAFTQAAKKFYTAHEPETAKTFADITNLTNETFDLILQDDKQSA
jgi:hypothetical protein